MSLGLVGARLSFVAANYDQYAPNPIPAVLEVWVRGLEIYGGLVGGFYRACDLRQTQGISPLAFADGRSGVVLAQAIGHWGDYFNQELFGKPSELPWAIRTLENRPAEFADAQSFHLRSSTSRSGMFWCA